MKMFLNFSLFFLLLSSPLFAKSDIDQLKQDVQWMKTSVENSNQKVAEAMNSLINIQQELASIKGSSESGGYLQEEQKRSLREYDQRLQAMEDKISNLTNLLNEIKEGRASEKVIGADEAQTKEFQRLLDLVSAEDYTKALNGFQAFIRKNPKSALSDNAQYWIAECYYGLNDYKKAIAEYQTFIKKYPQSPKVKISILKQGLSFMGLKMYVEAKPFFEKVVSEYPNSSESAKASQKIKEIERLTASSSSPISNPVPAAPQNKPVEPKPAPTAPSAPYEY